ncbi:MAG: DUF349 domain-containing protein [Marinilabiliaceae bacterium]
MEENESSLLNNQQEPEIKTNEAQPANSEAKEANALEASKTTDVQAEANDADGEAAKAEGAAAETPAIKVLLPEELKSMTDGQILDYLKDMTARRPARPAREAVDAVKAEVSQRMTAAAEKSELFEGEHTAEGETEPTAERTSAETETPALWKEIEGLIEAFESAVAAEKEEARKKMELNAEAKQKLVDRLKDIVKTVETTSASSLLHSVREITSEWKSIGSVPSSKKNLAKEFKNLADEYFGSLKIEREMRDLDHKRNMLEKEKLCEQAEALANEQSIRKAYNQVQKLRDAWKAIGPVSREDSEKIWARFSEAANVINKKFKQLNAEEREKEKENYQKKLAMCDEVEAYVAKERTGRKDFEEIADKAQEFVAKWKTVGFAPKSVNDEIYARFRKAIDTLYALRKSFYKEQDAQYAQNYRLKEALCEKAESVMNSNDWRKTTDYLIELQREWKDVGPVAHKQSELIWRRFRKACDTFFDNKQSQRDGETAEMQENLKKKQQIIEDLTNYQAPESQEQHLADLKEFLQRWNSVGMVPGKDFASIGKKFSELLNKHYDKLNIDKAEIELERFRGKIEALAAEGGDRLQKEKAHLMTQIRQAEQAAETLGNNINFFSKSKNADKLIKEYQSKIEKAKDEVAQLNKRLAIINEIAARK